MEADKFFVRTKILFKCDDILWAQVNAFKIENHIKNNNEALKVLIIDALDLKKSEKLLTTTNKY